MLESVQRDVAAWDGGVKKFVKRILSSFVSMGIQESLIPSQLCLKIWLSTCASVVLPDE